MDMRDHIKPILRRNPDAIVMHVGTNSLRSSATVRDCAEEIVNLATMISNESSADLAISAISIYTLSDLGVLSNLIGSLSLANEHYSPPTE